MFIDELIFDRTEQDLMDKTDKAFIDYVDLNRIEGACQELANILNLSITTKTWQMTDYRTQVEMDRLRDNLKLIQDSYYKTSKIPNVPASIKYTSITEANNIERMIFETYQLYLRVLAGCQTFSFKLGTKKFGNKEV